MQVVYDVLVGVNLLREGLDLPEVSLVAILDADKEGFLRSHRSLTQTAGRAARNVNGKVIMYADNITDSMQKTIDETARRRSIQLKYNADHGITPKQIVKAITSALPTSKEEEAKDWSRWEPRSKPRVYVEPESASLRCRPYRSQYEQGRTGEEHCQYYGIDEASSQRPRLHASCPISR